MSNTPGKQNLISRLTNYWQSLKNSRPIVVGISFAIAINTIVGFTVSSNQLGVLITSQNKLQYEGWVLVKINGFGRVYYESNIIENFASVFSLSRRSKIITLIYTDALPTIEQINSGDVKDNDISVLTNLDWEGHLADNNTNKLVKINSQTLQSKLVSIKELKKLICLYVGGVRNGKESSYLNILKIKIPDEDLNSIVENYQNEAVIKNKCKLGGAEHVLKKVDR